MVLGRLNLHIPFIHIVGAYIKWFFGTIYSLHFVENGLDSSQFFFKKMKLTSNLGLFGNLSSGVIRLVEHLEHIHIY